MHPDHTTTLAARESILDHAGRDILGAVENDWRRMCGNEVQSTPLALDPFRMDLALSYTFILKRTGPGAARIRVAGQKLHQMMGNDPRGQSFSAFFADGSGDTLLELLEACLTLPAILRVPLTAPRGFGRRPIRGEALLLPMRDTLGELNRAMGVIVPESDLKARTVAWSIDPARDLYCDVQDGSFPDRRRGPRQDKTPAPQRLRLVVDNTRAQEIA